VVSDTGGPGATPLPLLLRAPPAQLPWRCLTPKGGRRTARRTVAIW